MPNQFKVGDKVRKLKGALAPYEGIVGMIKGTRVEGIVTDGFGNGNLPGYSFGCQASELVLVAPGASSQQPYQPILGAHVAATQQVPPQSSQGTSVARPSSIQVGDKVRIIDVNATILPPSILGKEVEVIQAPGCSCGSNGRPCLIVDIYGSCETIIGDVYEEIPQPQSQGLMSGVALHQQATNAAVYAARQQAAAVVYGMSKWETEEVPPEMSRWQRPKCECGSDKVGSPQHSTWCPKHTAST